MDPVFWALRAFQILAIEADEAAATAVYLGVVDQRKLAASVQGSSWLGKFARQVGLQKQESGGGGYYDRLSKRTSGADLLSDYDLDRLWVRWCADCDIKWS